MAAINQNGKRSGMISGRRFNNFAPIEHAENVRETLKRVLGYFTKEKGLLCILFIVVVIATSCGILGPIFQSKAVDIISGKSEDNFMFFLTGMIVSYGFYCIFQLLQGVFSAKISQRTVKKLRNELFEKIVDLPIAFMDTHSHGDIMSRMTNDIENISTTVSLSLPSFISGILTVCGTFAVMFFYCKELAVLSCLTIFLTFFATNFISKKVRKFSRTRQELLGNLNGTVEEMIYGFHTVTAFDRKESTNEEFSKNADSLTKAGIITDCFSGIMGPVMNCIGNIGFVIISIFGGYFALKGIITVGVISAFIVYAKQFTRPINEIAQIYGQLQTALAGAERVFAVLDEKNEDTSGEELSENQNMKVSFKNVNFGYTKETKVLKDFNLEIEPGKKVAIVGATGSGKTTIVNLLMKFYNIDSGQILINSQNIADVSTESLRKKVSIVLQDTVLFRDTLENNLRYSNIDATKEEIDKALKMSRCDELVKHLPEGLHTSLASDGENISQGQRQLIAIARAFISDPGILILDEATSNVDTRTEKNIQSAMQEVMKERTSIVIAHRLSTIRDADMIVVIDKGRVVEKGNHEELLLKKGKYYDLYMTQYAGKQT